MGQTQQFELELDTAPAKQSQAARSKRRRELECLCLLKKAKAWHVGLKQTLPWLYSYCHHCLYLTSMPNARNSVFEAQTSMLNRQCSGLKATLDCGQQLYLLGWWFFCSSYIYIVSWCQLNMLAWVWSAVFPFSCFCMPCHLLTAWASGGIR